MTARRIVLDCVIAGDRARRRARAWAHAASALPWIAASALAASLAALVAGRARIVGALILAAGAVALFVIIVAARRRRTPPDPLVAAIDRAAGLGGALRSAHWFAAEPPESAPRLHDPVWVAHHVETTAARAAEVNWHAVFPRQPAARAWLVSAALAAGALALTGVESPGWATRPAPAVDTGEPGDTLIVIPPNLSGEVMKGLNALKAGQPPPKETLTAVGQALEIARKDPRAKRDLEELFARGVQDPSFFDDGWMDDHDWDVNEMPWEDAISGVEWAYEAASARAAIDEPDSGADPGQTTGREGRRRAGTPDRGRRPTSPPDAAPVRADTRGQAGSFASLLFGRQQAKDPAPGEGARSPGATPASVAAALRREVVHAQQDASDATRPGGPRRDPPGSDTPAGTGGVRPTGLRYDASAAGRPPAVPEAREALVHDFFARPAVGAAAAGTGSPPDSR